MRAYVLRATNNEVFEIAAYDNSRALLIEPDRLPSNRGTRRLYAPGTDLDFRELLKLRRAAFDSMNLDRAEIAYQTISGVPSGTYIFLTPLASLRSLDNGIAKTPAYAEAMTEAGAKDRRKIASEIELSREQILLRTEPRLSNVSESFASADPEFWGLRR